jgi:hypothetical protein
LIMAAFMHETDARKLTRIVSTLGFIGLAILLGLALIPVRVPPSW